ncbi:2-oxoglutarate and iron-dependent oxygenase domain-containing protein 3 isoform X4 [Takifugu rubripes]|uniref:2-oxoglutarate and iron-dependent oxygenase domain-containing protein 3 isoform X4 n=1 Tax=Takifugu rubripes TaxID=31033 RepID=UPI0005D27C42|nr:2-oxoglutarate and iron-dependent oxygenase domain-containing protein 3 isoform X4 [Takifugu rubripes]|eukprot:XP_011616843.1 PREDICTED: 2-oxoglutarate and iron-dependent oxygenase domain-containing protein 3 isoform X2 [Takifugu rubripes]
MKKQFLFREANGWTEILLKPGSERDFRQASQVVGVVLYPYKTVKYECYAVGIYFQMALLRQRTAQGSNAAEIEKKIKRGNALRQGSAWRGSRATAALLLVTVSVFVAALWLYVTSLDSDVTETLVSQAEFVSPQPRVYNIQCSEDYNNYKRYPGCTPQKCGRAVIDAVVSREEAQSLKRLAERGLALAGSEGGASILDLHSGALSMGRQFVNIYRINSTTAKTQHDEYWHPHIDKVTYGSFDYTSLLYLSDYGSDFSGGRFIFMDQDSNSTVEPRAGRVSFFSSGSENIHRVEKVTWGTRYAITVSFTCDPEYAISDPALH